MINIFKFFLNLILVILFILFIKNYKRLYKKYNWGETSLYVLIEIIVCTIITIFAFFQITSLLKAIGETISYSHTVKENNAFFNESDDKTQIELNYYKKQLEEVSYDINNSMNPYIPDGFRYVLGEWNTGFVIEDENQNQYVWVPCGDKDYEDYKIPQLTKTDYYFGENNIPYNVCYDDNYEDFIISALSNGGFYISRYEIGIDNKKIVSKENVDVYEIKTKELFNYKLNKMYEDNKEINVNIINGFAYDTTLNWIKLTNDIKIVKEKDLDTILTGRNSYNNIYDYTDNVLEFSDEILYDTYIIRGFMYIEEGELQSRYNVLDNFSRLFLYDKVGTRIILYK